MCSLLPFSLIDFCPIITEFAVPCHRLKPAQGVIDDLDAGLKASSTAGNLPCGWSGESRSLAALVMTAKPAEGQLQDLKAGSSI
jgi:hypothetical protein